MVLNIVNFFCGILKESTRTKKAFSLALVTLLASSAATVGSLVLFKSVIDGFLIQETNAMQALKWIGFYIALQMIGRFLSDYGFLAYAKFEQTTQKAMGHYIFKHLHKLSLRVYLERQVGSLAHTVDHGFSGLRNLFYTLFTGILPVFFDVLFIVGLLYFFYGVLFALLSIGFMAAYLTLTQCFSRKIDREQKIYMGHIRGAFGTCFDSLLNYETVKYFGNEKRVAEEFSEELGRLEVTALKAVRTISYLGYSQSALTTLFMGSMLAILGFQITGHHLRISDLVMINLYMLQMTRPLSLLAGQIRGIRYSLFELEALANLVAEKSDIVDSPDAIDLKSIQEIHFKDVAFSHREDKSIFTHLNLTLTQGERVGVVGSSGSGKTTLTRLLFRLYEPQGGRILINGRNIKEYKIDSLRGHLSIVPQEVVLFNDTILRNIQFGNPAASQKEIEKAAQKAGIHTFITSLPEQYDTPVGERGMKLSGGERQRIGIARAILKNPDLYIFDEATSSLDTQTEKEIQKNLVSISEGKTTLMIAHRLSTVVDCDRILVMQAGEIVEEGTHEALLDQKGLYASLWKAQIGERKTQKQKIG